MPSTSHSKIQGNIATEFNISWALVIRHYRLVVAEHWLPVPFNMVQFLVLLPFHVLPGRFQGEKCRKVKGAIKERVGQVVFWLVMGSIAVTSGTILWAVSAVTSPFVWRKHYARAEEKISRTAKTGDKSLQRCRSDTTIQDQDSEGQDSKWYHSKTIEQVRGQLTLLAWCILGAPLFLLYLWLRAPFCGLFGRFGKKSVHHRTIGNRIEKKSVHRRTRRTAKEILEEGTDGRTAGLAGARIDNAAASERVPRRKERKIAATASETTGSLRDQLGKRASFLETVEKEVSFLESIEKESSENNTMLKEVLGILNQSQSRRPLAPRRPRTSPSLGKGSPPISRTKRASEQTGRQPQPRYKEPSPLPPTPALGSLRPTAMYHHFGR